MEFVLCTPESLASYTGFAGTGGRGPFFPTAIEYPGAVTDLSNRLGAWSEVVGEHLQGQRLCPASSDLESWAVLSHHIHADLIQHPTLFPNRREFAKYDLARLRQLACLSPSELKEQIFDKIPFAPKYSEFRFIDLFAGIGGFRIGLQNVGGVSVFSSELNTTARRTYAKNFGDVPIGDIRSITRAGTRFRNRNSVNSLIPDFDLVAGGFPCQPFSLAGVSSRRHHGLNDGLSCTDQGTLFDDIIAVIRAKSHFGKAPKVLFLENVRNLMFHDSGRTFKVIKSRIEDCGYVVFHRVIDSQALVPQRRKRIFFVCIREDLVRGIGSYAFPEFPIPQPPLALELILDRGKATEQFQISSRLWASHRRRSKRHAAKGNGFTIQLADLKRPANTLVSRYYKDGKDCLISMGGSRNPRMLTPRECARLQGFDPALFILPDSRTAAYRAFGNAVTVPVAQKIAESLTKYLK